MDDNLENIEYGKNFYVCQEVQNDNEITIYLKPKPHESRCPSCGQASSKLACDYHRKIQETPYCNKHVVLDVTVYKYYCLNPKCDRRVFCDSLPFANKYQVKTKELDKLIISVSLHSSSNQASGTLSHQGVKVTGATIQNLYHRIKSSDNPNIKSVGIDDISTRKGVKYATIIYDLKAMNQWLC